MWRAGALVRTGSVAALCTAVLSVDTLAAPPTRIAVPFYTASAFMQGLHPRWYAPRSTLFLADATYLRAAIERLCESDAAGAQPSLQQARARWKAAAHSWDTLSAVAVGPLVDRRSARHIDFSPARPALIERAIRAQPRDLTAMERVGTPAKGFPALEWLLWTRPVAPATPACRYAALAAREVEVEAKTLAEAFDALSSRDWRADEAAAVAAMGELVNQWVGALQHLRWGQMEKPLRTAASSEPSGQPEYPRSASGSTRETWRAQWRALQALGAADGKSPPAPGAGLVPVETYLRGRGLNGLADRLAAASRGAESAIAAADPADAGRTMAAARSLASLKRLVETEVAPALEVQIGFSDQDGD